MYDQMIDCMIFHMREENKCKKPLKKEHTFRTKKKKEKKTTKELFKECEKTLNYIHIFL